MNYPKEQLVYWNWGNGKAKGKISEIHTSEISKTIKGSQITRKASKENPAYTIIQNDGDIVLKSESELLTDAK